MKIQGKILFLFSLLGFLWVLPVQAVASPFIFRSGFLATASSTVTSTLDVYGTTTLRNVTINGTCSGCLSGQTASDWVKSVTFGVSVLTPSTTIPFWDKSALYVSSTAQIDGALTVNGAASMSNVTTTGMNTGILGINGQYFNNILGTGLTNSAGALTVSLSAFSTTNLSEGTNLYYTADRWDTRFAATSTTGLAEGTRLYWTSDRFDTRLAATTTLKNLTTLTGVTSIGTLGSLAVSGLSTLTGGFISSASSSIGGSLSVTGATTISSTLGIYGSQGITLWGNNIAQMTLANNSFSIIGTSGQGITTTTLLQQNAFNFGYNTSTFRSGVLTINDAGNLSASGTLKQFGLSTLAGGFISTASSSVSAGLQVAGAFNASGSIFVAGNILPSSANNSDVGSMGLGFRNIFASSSFNVSSATVSSTHTGNYLSLSTNNTTFGSSTILTPDTLIIGQTTTTLFQKGLFWIDGTVGGNGSIYSSGTLKIAGLSTLAGFISTASSTASGLLMVSGNLAASSTLGITDTTTLYSAFLQNSFNTCNGSANKVVYNAGSGLFGCDTDQTSGGTAFTTPVTVTFGGAVANLRSDSFSLATSTGNLLGSFNIDSQGNVTASGTYKQFGLSTLGGLISTASSSISAGLQVAGALSASGTLQVAGNTVLQALTVTSCSGCLPAADWVNGTTYNVLTMTPSTTKAMWDKSALYVSSTLQVDSLATFNSGLYINSTSVSSTHRGNFLGLSYTSAGLTTSTFYASDAFQLGINTSTFKTGVLSVDNAGNLSASGTLKQYGLSTLTGFISTASSSVSGNLQVSGQLNVSSTLNISKGTGTTTINEGDSGKGNGSKVCHNVRNAGGTTSSYYWNAASVMVSEAKACL